jgi:peptidoglycan hydrolase CwlO-like protein
MSNVNLTSVHELFAQVENKVHESNNSRMRALQNKFRGRIRSESDAWNYLGVLESALNGTEMAVEITASISALSEDNDWVEHIQEIGGSILEFFAG